MGTLTTTVAVYRWTYGSATRVFLRILPLLYFSHFSHVMAVTENESINLPNLPDDVVRIVLRVGLESFEEARLVIFLLYFIFIKIICSIIRDRACP